HNTDYLLIMAPVLAKALYDYQGNVPGELAMKSGDMVGLRCRVDDNWYYGDIKGNTGLIPSSMVQILSEQSQPAPLCRALYDFDLSRLDPDDRKECLAFMKGDVITVIKRVDENWGEGKLGEKVGIFPLQFTEPNPTAFKLLASAKASDLAEFHPRNARGSSRRESLDAGSHRRLSRTQASTARPPDVSVLNTLNHGQTQSSTAPSAPLKPGRLSAVSKLRAGSTRRSQSKGERKMNGEVPPTITMALINPQGPPPQAESKQSPIQQLSISVCAALYSYTPHRPEELELSKGEMVGVYGKFKEGWLRGLSLRTGKVGILPANYVTPVLRTSAMFVEQPKLAVPSAAIASAKRYTPQNPKAASLPLDKVKVEVAAPVGAMPPQAAVPSGSAVKSPQAGGKQGWDMVRRAFQSSHRGSFRHSSYHPQNPGSSLHPPPQDLGQIYGFGRSPVLPRKRNGLFTNPIRSQHWTYEGATPSAGGGAYQPTDTRYTTLKETSTAPQSILIKPDTHRHNTEKPVKTVRFLTEEVPQTTTRLASVSSGSQIMGNSQSGPVALEHWNPSAIIGRDGSTSVFKDTKTIMQRKGHGQNNASGDFLPLSTKLYTANSQSSPIRHRVLKAYNAKTDAELNLLEGELVLVQKPRSDGRVLTHKLDKPEKSEVSDKVKVVVRCRPLNQKEKMMGYKQSVTVDEIRGTITVNKLETPNEPPKTFTFDTVFSPDSKQLDVYNLTARPIIDSVLEGYNGKGRELADVMERRKVDILCVQETRWKGSKARSIGAGFKLFYYGVDSKTNGVGVVLKEEFVRNVLEVKRVSDRVMSLKLEIEGVMLNVVSGYAPQVGCELEEKERFWSELDEVMESIPTGERVVIGADFNGHVGEGNTGDEEVMGKFGVKERNLEGQMVVDFAKRMDMGVVNTYFQKREEHRVTYKSGGRRTQVDYILCRRGNLKEISDCKVVVGESVARQHRMVVCRMTLMVCKTKRSKIEKKTKWWKLKKEECCEEFRQKLRQALGGQVVLPDDWETTAEVIRETGRKVLGVSSGRRKEDKETWWWNEEVQDSIQRKRLAKKKWDMDRTEENRQEYKELQRRVKREVSKAKQKAYEELYTRLDTREGEKDLYRLARQRDRDGKDMQQVRVIKDRDGRVLTSEESVQRRWKEYFEELMNEENEREKRVEGVNSVEQKVDKIRKDEVRKALKRMKSGKAVGPDDIPVEVWKCLGEAAVEFLANLFNRVLESERMPEEWRRSVLVPIFKNKGDVQSCSNYRGIKLMSHTMKVWERVVEARLRKVVEICEQQYGFMPRKSTTDAIFALRILMEKYRDGQKELHCVFVDLEKAYDRVPREELWYCMRKSGVAEKYVRVVQDMYERSRTVVRCAVGQTEEFNVEVGLHQGSALSPFLFAMVMDQLSEEVRQESPWTMMFADDIVICSESREQVEENLERWRFALERRGMKVSRSKTEYMCVNEREGSGTVRLQGEEVKKVQEFKYLGSTVQSNGECGKEVQKRVQAGWNGWRKVSGVLCDQKISARIKGKVYRTVVRPAMLYGLETVSWRKSQESELEVAELKMLRFSLGVTRLDRIRNEYIRGTAHVGRLGDKVREARLRWFGHVQRRDRTIFAYGQTGTGKTFTMEGVRAVPELRGIIPNSFAHIFGHIAKAEGDTRFLVRVSYLEIYNEEVRDLLGKDQMQRLEVKERPDVGVYIKDLSGYVVNNADDMDRIMTLGHKNRSVGATNMNEHSSRSHAIFTITIECSEKGVDGNQHVRMGKLHLVDLAGSERQGKTGATGQRLKEATKINLSLSTLGNVISALVDGKSTHVPYRNSKLTRLLQDSLGGNSKTMMCANIGPADYNYDETISTLRYANRAKNIKNKARINEDPKDALLRQFQKEIEELKKKLEEGEEISGSEGSGSEDMDEGEDETADGGERRRKRRGKKKVSPDKMAEMQAKIDEERKALEAKLDMEEEERNKARAELEKREKDLLKAQQEHHLLLEKLSALEKKVIVGGVDLLAKAEEQEKLLEESNNELEERRKRAEQLRRELEEKEQERLDIEEKYTSLQEEAQGKTKKLKKVWTMLMAAKSEMADLQQEHHREIEGLLENIRQLSRELRLQMLIIDNFIPQEYQEMIENYVHWNEDIGEWQLKCVAYTGNNMRKQTPVPDKKEKDPFEVDLSHVYLAYTEESMRQSLMRLERPRTSKSGKARPKTGRRKRSSRPETAIESLLQ
ncbi:hypothetical protein QTP86_017253, partial [Hemibagrus guttatus]